jgi:hypothetical protein
MRAEYIVEQGGATRVVHAVDPDVNTAVVLRAWAGTPPPRFRAYWSGFLVARGGIYTLAMQCNDTAAVSIDGANVIVSRPPDQIGIRSARVQLTRGPHRFSIDLDHQAGAPAIELSLARGRDKPAPLAAWQLWRTPVGYGHAVAAYALPPLTRVALIVCVLIGITLAWPFVAVTLGATPRILIRLALLATTLTAALLMVEFGARLAFRHVRSAGDARTYFARHGAQTRVNNLGYRDPDVPLVPTHYRIVAIGDSITWGQGLTEDERFTTLVQQSLGPSADVVNFGIPGRNMPEHLQALDQALRIHPDFILLQIYTNDFETDEMERPRVRPLLPWRGVDRWLLRSSALYSLMSIQWQQLQPRLGLCESYEQYMQRYLGNPDSPVAQQSFGRLREFFARVHAAHVPSGAIVFPNPAVLGPRAYSFDYIHDRVLAICAAQQVQCVDLRQPFVTHFHDLREIVVSPFDGHPSPAANRVAADELLATFGSTWRQAAAVWPSAQRSK